MQKVNIAFCFDKNLWKHFCVEIISLLNVSKNKCDYDIYAIISNDITKDIQEEIRKIFDKYNINSTLTFIPITNDFKKSKTNKEKGFYFRLHLPQLLPNIDKIIYADIDIIFNKDLKDFYNQDMKDYILFGVKDGLNITRPWKKHMARMPKNYNTYFTKGDYINSGVLLMNLKAMRKLNLYKEFCDLMELSFPHRDQDILNITCKNHIKILPLKYNFTPRSTHKYKKLIKEKYMTNIELKEAKTSAIIYHFINHNPWNKITKKANLWWQYAHLTPYYEDFKKNFLNKASPLQKMKFFIMEYKNKRGIND